jgi:uncharacterized protein (DUF2141 family)
MKHLPIFALLFVLLTACGESEPQFTDNGNPGQIKAIFFYDDNKNGTMDAGEAGVQAQQIAGMSQEISCPPTSTPVFQDSDSNGFIEFNDLKPGKYCLYLNNGFTPVTKLTQEVYVSSDMVTTVYFGLGR